MDLKDKLTLILGAVTAVIALAALAKAIFEYKRSTAAKRMEMFLSMRTRLREDKDFAEICELLERDDQKLQTIPLVQKDRFTGFFEELAIMKNSGLINSHVTLYMFGYWAIRCNKSKHFWYGLNRQQTLWTLFFSFADEMEKAQKSFHFKKSNYQVR